jgi:hypothetical protein
VVFFVFVQRFECLSDAPKLLDDVFNQVDRYFDRGVLGPEIS